MEGTENNDRRDEDYAGREDIYSQAVRAGKRTYFFDVKATRGNDYYLTITESKRKYNDDGTFRYNKHKIFLYKEDFKKFSDALAHTITKIIELRSQQDDELASSISDSLTDVNFEDLGTIGQESQGYPEDQENNY